MMLLLAMSCSSMDPPAQAPASAERSPPPPVEPLDLVINEVMASNETSLLTGEESWDWIEIYNPMSIQADLSTISVTDDPANLTLHTLPSLIVPAGGFLVLHASGDATLGDDHLPFKLNAGGEFIALVGPNGRILNQIEYGDQISDVALLREVDGGPDFVYRTMGTPGASNN